MSVSNKDSHKVAEFMSLFTRLKDLVNDRPEELETLTSAAPDLQSICRELLVAAMQLASSERQSRKQFASPVNPSFLVAWREYNERYTRGVERIFGLEFGIDHPKQPEHADFQWHSADAEARENLDAIEEVFDYVHSAIDHDISINDDAAYQLNAGIFAWGALKSEIGLDLQGVFRRRQLIPFVLVPRHVGQKYGDSELPSLYSNLQQAHETFVFGAHYAALALIRSILDVVLRDHFRIAGKDLSERINNSTEILPKDVNKAALHRIRENGNAVLHLNEEKTAKFRRFDQMTLEKEIVSHLLVLRNLIEGVV